jgi:hypothetical protein
VLYREKSFFSNAWVAVVLRVASHRILATIRVPWEYGDEPKKAEEIELTFTKNEILRIQSLALPAVCGNPDAEYPIMAQSQKEPQKEVALNLLSFEQGSYCLILTFSEAATFPIES